MRIEAQGKYMQTILEKACQTLARENTATGGGEMCFLKEMGSPLGFPSLHDLHLYAGGVHHLVDETCRGDLTHMDSTALNSGKPIFSPDRRGEAKPEMSSPSAASPVVRTTAISARNLSYG